MKTKIISKKVISKKVISIMLSLLMILSMVPMHSLTAFAADGVSYLDYTFDEATSTLTETEKTVTEYTEVTSDLTAWSDGWYVVNGEVTVGNCIEVSGTVNLILADGASLTANRGISVNSGNAFIIYAQSKDEAIMGKLTATNVSGASGIGGGYMKSAGTITINGGNITAKGGTQSAGIGGGVYGNSGNITINGGTVTAVGGHMGACIGGGAYGNGETITINGGTVTAVAIEDGASGIGGGFEGNGGTITINGGLVTATGGSDGAGIGGGAYGNGGNVTITGGTVTATGGSDGAGIGGGSDGNGGNVTITGGNINAVGGEFAEAIGMGNSGTDSGTLTDGTNALSLKTYTLDGASANTVITEVKGISYNINDVVTLDDNKLYFYLPENAELQSAVAGETEYICNINGTLYTEHKDTYSVYIDEVYHGTYCKCNNILIENGNHIGGTATCVSGKICDLCKEAYGEFDPYTHIGNYKPEYQWYPEADGTCYVSATLYCTDCGEYVDGERDYATQINYVEPENCSNQGSVTYSITLTMNGKEYTATETFPVASDNHIGEFDNGFCSVCGGYEKPEIQQGEYEWETIYLIDNAGKLFWFADYINNVSNEANALVTKDITIPEGKEWTPMMEFYGTFDGGFKTISGLNASGETYVGMFGGGGYARGTIKNLGLTNSHFEGTSNVGGIAGYHEGTIENCYVDGSVTVVGSSMTGMLVGNNAGTVRNCYAYSGSLVGYMYPGYGSIENCYFLSGTDDSFDGTTAKTAEQFASGEVAYLLQSGIVGEDLYDEDWNYIGTADPEHIWGQNIGTENYPVFKGEKVYKNQIGGCCEENYVYGYANTEKAPVSNHIYDENGACICGDLNYFVIGQLSSQIRFGSDDNNATYNHTFDVRTRAKITDADFYRFVGATNEEAVKNITKAGFVYSINPETFSLEDAKIVAQGGKVAGYTDAPINYIQDADGYYTFTCIVTNIPDTEIAQTLVSFAYICVEIDGVEYWYFMDTQAEADFKDLYTRCLPMACEAYGWGIGDWKENGDGTHSRNCGLCGKIENGDCVYDKYVNNDDGTHNVVCSICGHIGTTETHTYNENGVCACGELQFIDATAMTAEQLNAAVAARLAAGETDITITLAPDAPVAMFTAIRRALIDTEGVADGSINLTLAGVTAIPDHDEYHHETAIFGEVWDDNGQNPVLQLASISLPDVLTIGSSAFKRCVYLTSLYAPNVQTVGASAFEATALTSVELPKATTIGSSGFRLCTSLTTVKLPSATIIGDRAFSSSNNITDLELTAEGAITLDTNVFNVPSQNFSQNVNLVLHGNKSGEVNGLTWKGYTFKSIEFLCTDGTPNHTYGAAVNNGDITHTYTCTTCNLTKVESCHGEATCKERATCEVCGVQFGELSDHILDSATGYCKFGCETMMAVVKVTKGDLTVYYSSLKDARLNTLDDATVTLLQNFTGEYMSYGPHSFTLDLNGYNLSDGLRNLYATGAGKTFTLINTGTTRAKVGCVWVYKPGNVTFTVKENADVDTIELNNNEATIDLSAADFTSCQFKVTTDGCNTSQVVLGDYAIYDESGNVVTGELTNGATYTIKAAQ